MLSLSSLFFKQRTTCLLLYLLLGGCFAAAGQPGQIIFKHYTANEGFDSNEAMDIAQTRDGLVWISSADGLIRFDSKNFKYFRHSNSNPQSIASNYCKAMQVDNRGRIWIVADDDLDIFDPATETFRHIKHTGKPAEQAAVKPKSFYYDAGRDIMWVATLDGLYFSKNSSGILENVSGITKDSLLPGAPVITITPEGRDWLWLTSGKKIVKLHTGTGATEHYTVPLIVSGKNNEGRVYTISSYMDADKTLWLGTFTMGLFSFNTVTKQFEHYTYRDEKKEDNSIFSITQTHLPGQEKVLFFGATGVGFGAFNTGTKKFTSYSSGAYHTVLGIKGTAYSLRCFNNKLWISSNTGLHCYDYSLQLFEKKDLSAIANGAALMPVDLMAAERNNKGTDERLWLHIPYKDGYIYDIANDKILPFPAVLKKYAGTDAGIFSMFIDSKNLLWLGTNAYGLVGYDIQQDRILTEKKQFYNTREWAHRFFEDSKGNMWIGTYKGLFMMDSSRNTVVPVSAVNDLIQREQASAVIAGITEDEYGTIWLTADFSAKKNAAIIQFNPVKNSAAMMYSEREEAGPDHNAVDIRAICSNKKGKIFVIFRSEHIAWFPANPSGKISFSVLERKQGLNNAYIDELLADSLGNIWCNNNLGISQYKVNQNSFSNYSFANYELSTTNNPSIYISPNSGKFYIGQSNSYLLFNEGNNRNEINSTSLLFNGLSIYNRIYPEKIKDGDRLTLNYRQDMISIEFALLSYSNAHENTYSWKLEGLEKDWNISKNNIATYSHLKPGHYTLLVKAANSNGDWKTVPIQLHIHIRPPFYATWWFRVMVTALLAGLVWWLIQRRIKRLKDKFEMRNGIASDLHDDVGSALTSINILSSILPDAMDEHPAHAKELLQQISLQSKTIQQNMSDIVWSIRPDNEKIENLLVRIREYAGQTLEPLEIDTAIEADDILINKILPMHYRKDILLICKEAINNIAKHSGAGSVKIRFSQVQKRVAVSIQDDGKWKGANSGTGTKSMQERALALGGELFIQTGDGGTEVLLLLPLP